ncbi:MAG: acyl carrier protein [Acidobacteriota bacterium]
MSEIERQVIEVLHIVLKNRGLQSVTVAPETRLDTSLGLESLDFAEVVVRLEEKTGQDPFADGRVPQVQTVSELAALYEQG